MIIESYLDEKIHTDIIGKKYNPVGIYAKGDNLAQGQERMLRKMCKYLSSIKKSSKILILGAGYGTAARDILKIYKCKVDCLNPNSWENEHNLDLSKEMGFEKNIQIIEGGLDKIPFKREYYDFVFSQDYLAFSENVNTLFKSVHYILKPKGRFVFSLPLRGNQLDCKLLNETPSHIHLKTSKEILQGARLADLSKIIASKKPTNLLQHFKLIRETYPIAKNSELESVVNNWQQAAENGCVDWGIYLFQKQNA